MKGYMSMLRGIDETKNHSVSHQKFTKVIEDQQTVDVWKFITNFIDENEIPPSMREIGKSVHLEQASVRRRMQVLEDWGHIRLIPRIARGIVLIDRPEDILEAAI